MANPSAGIGDPYWYEWSVGLTHIIELLNPDSGVDTVTLQSSRPQGLDDVIVDHRSGLRRCIQVKHTRVGETLTLGDLLSIDQESKSDRPLLGYLASAWKEATDEGRACTAELCTNRSAGERASRTRGELSVARPPLIEFWPRVKAEVDRVDDIRDVRLAPGWHDAWAEWLAAIGHLGPEEQLAFLKALSIDTNQPELAALEQRLIHRLEELFRCSAAQASQLFAGFDHALRRWTVSTRAHAAIDVEDVCAALTLANEPVGTAHLIAPPEPFFPSRDRLLLELGALIGDASVRLALLTGGPGCGKTSVMSKLANAREPLIDIRFHAYRPITPDTVHLPPDADIDLSRRGLWGALLAQLRHLLVGRLFEYRVPVRNALLDADQLRAAVIAVAARIGIERGRSFVIAIDGLDHAARAGRPDALALLSSIPHPNEVPDGVFILLGGQPPEAWGQYPLWLRTPTPTLRRIDVPPLDAADVHALIKHDAPHLEPLDVVAALISDVSKGDTLSAVFAVQEAKLSETVTVLQERLGARMLHSGLQAYYDSIWTSSTQRLAAPGALVAFRLAAALSMLDSRVSGELLDEIYRTPSLGVAEWNDSLVALRPLVVQDPNGFRVTHNDVRVFLTSFLRGDPARSQAAASSLADYLLSENAPVASRYRSLVPALRLAQRGSEIAPSFSVEYVVKAWRAGGSLDVLCGQGLDALDAIHADECQHLHGVVVSLATLRQLDRCCDFYQYPSGEREGGWSGPALALRFECQTLAPEAWDAGVIIGVLDDVLRLTASDEEDRARGMMQRWFHSMSPTDVAAALRNGSDVEFAGPRDDAAADEALDRLGRVAFRLEASFEDAAIGSSDEAQRDWALFYDGFTEEAAHHADWRVWARALQQVRIYHPSSLENTTRRFASDARWREVALALRKLRRNRADRSAAFQCEAAAWSLLIGNRGLIDTWVAPIVADPFAATRTASDRDDRAISAIATAFVLGWSTHREPAAIRDAAMSAYGESHPNSEARALLSFLNHAAAIVGRWHRTQDPPVSVAHVEELVARLLGHAGHYEMWKIFERAAPALFRLLMAAATRSAGVYSDAVLGACLRYAESGGHGFATREVWAAQRDRGNIDRLSAWVERLFGSGGEAWRRSTDSRLKELALFRELVLRTSGLEHLAPKLDALSRSAVLGYLGDDDYGLSRSFKWFEKLSRLDPGSWADAGIELLTVSKEAEEAGHNKLAYNIESTVARAAAVVGPEALAAFRGLLDPRDDGPWKENTETAWRDGLLGYLEESHLDRRSLAAIWAACLGSLSWRHHRDIEELRTARKIIEEADDRLGHRLAPELQLTTPLEWSQASMTDARARSRRENEPKTQELFSEIDSLDSERALPFAAALFGDRSTREAAYAVATRLARRFVTAADQARAGALLHAALEHRENTEWPWSYDGLLGLIMELGPVLGERDRWRLVGLAIGRVDRADPRNALLLVEDLDSLCLAVASEGPACATGLRRHIRSHELWIPTGHTLAVPRIAATKGPKDWSAFCIELLMDILAGDSALLCESALRGLWALAHVNPDACNEIGRRAASLRRDERELVLQMIERLAATNVALARHFEDFIVANERSSELEIEVQAWLTRSAITRAAQEALPAVPSVGEQDMSTTFILPPERLVVRNDDAPTLMMRSTTGNQAVATVLKQLESTMMIDVEGLELRYLASLREMPLEPQERTDWARPGDSVYVGGEGVSRLVDVVRSQLPAGKERTFWILLAQGLLTADEPAVLHGPWSVMTGVEWPVEERLDGLLNKSAAVSRSAFRDLLWCGVPADQVVFAGIAFLHSHYYNARVKQLPLLMSSTPNVVPPPNHTTIGARGFAVYDTLRFENRRSVLPRWLALTGAGLGRIPTMHLGVVPSSLLQAQAGWMPTVDPITWLAKDGSSVRYERVYAPVRTAARETAFHQSYFERWICTRSAMEQLSQQLHGVISERLEVDRVHTGAK